MSNISSSTKGCLLVSWCMCLTKTSKTYRPCLADLHLFQLYVGEVTAVVLAVCTFDTFKTAENSAHGPGALKRAPQLGALFKWEIRKNSGFWTWQLSFGHVQPCSRLRKKWTEGRKALAFAWRPLSSPFGFSFLRSRGAFLAVVVTIKDRTLRSSLSIWR